MSNPITNYGLVSSVTSADLLWDWQSGAQQSCTMAQVKTFLLGGGSIAIAGGKTLTISNSFTCTATDGSVIVFGAGGTVIYAASIGSTVQAYSAKLAALAALAVPAASFRFLASDTSGNLSWLPQTLAATASGTNIYTATPSPALTAYSTGQAVVITFTNANTAGASLNLNGLGAAAIQQSGLALDAGQITANSVLALIYDGTNFQIVGPASPLVAVVNANPAALSVSSTTGSALLRGAATTLQDIAAGAGSGSYTYTLTLGTTGAVLGDRIEIRIALAASTNPTVAIVGTATENVAGNGTAFSSYLVYWFNGTSWDLKFRSA